MKKYLQSLFAKFVVGFFLLLCCILVSSLSLDAQCYVKIKGAIGGVSSCNPDGTATFRIIVDYIDAPGNLYINGQLFPVAVGTSANNTTFNVVFPGDGTSQNVTMFFVDEPSCSDTTNGLFLTPLCVPFDACDLDIISVGPPVCTSTTTYSIDVNINYFLAEGSIVNIMGQIFVISNPDGSGSDTFTVSNLPTNGSSVNVTASFLNDFTCNDQIVDAFTAPSTCSTTPVCPAAFSFATSNQLVGNVTTDIDYEANGIIESNQTILSITSGSPVVDYDSGLEIYLDPDFEVKLGAVFHAFIDGCGNQ